MKKEIAYGFIDDDKIFQLGWGDHPAREIGQIRNDDEESSVAYFQNRFDALSKKINTLIAEIDKATNKGSFLQKIVHLKETLHEHDGLGDYEQLEKVLIEKERTIKNLIEENRQKNTATKKVLLSELEDIVLEVNWRLATEKVLELKARWMSTGNALPDENERLNDSFWSIHNNFFERKKAFYEDKKRLIDLNISKYEAIIAECQLAKNLTRSDKSKAVQALKVQWKEVGIIPKTAYQPLFDKFQRAIREVMSSNIEKEKLEELLALSQDQTIATRDRKSLESIRNDLQRLTAPKNKKEERNRCLDHLNLLIEEKFIEERAAKKVARFEKMDESEKLRIRLMIIQELIARDREELDILVNNEQHFKTSDKKTLNLIKKKVSIQKKKIEIKETLQLKFKQLDRS